MNRRLSPCSICGRAAGTLYPAIPEVVRFLILLGLCAIRNKPFETGLGFPEPADGWEQCFAVPQNLSLTLSTEEVSYR